MKTKFKEVALAIGQAIGIALSIFIISYLLFAQSTWQGPTSSPPGGNVPAPLSSGTENQFKEGALGIGGVFQTDNETHLSTQGGSVGIGTTEPPEKLSLQGPDAKLHVRSQDNTNNAIHNSGISFATDVNSRRAEILVTRGPSSARTGLQINTYSDEVIEALRINHDGNVGIGTTNPGAKLDVDGVINMQGSPVVESGSNSHGSWTKWADGTMIITADTPGTSGWETATFPQSFANTAYIINGNPKPGSGDNDHTYGVKYRNKSTDSIDVLLTYAAADGSASRRSGWGTDNIIYGRWK